MPRVTFLLPDGGNSTVEAVVGDSLMETARKNRISGITAECGGQRACSTCHVILHPDWYDKFAAPSEAESLMYQFAPGNAKTSRLSCQLPITEVHDGIVVRVPAEQA